MERGSNHRKEWKAAGRFDINRLPMYAIIKDGGRQFRVEKGLEVEVDRKTLEPGARIEFDQVLALHDGEKLTVGTPVVFGARVVGEVVKEVRDPKIRVFRFIRREDSHRSYGHRQRHTLVRITDIIPK